MSQFAQNTIQHVQVVTTYVAMDAQEQFRPGFSDNPEIDVIEAKQTSVQFYRYLYQLVGEHYHWTDRLAWGDQELAEYLQRASVRIFVLYVRGTPAGYIELNSDSEETGTEVVYFGLAPAYHGLGFGKHLLSVGVQQAFADGAERVWLHTCSLDGKYALANYQARGFVPYKTTSHEHVLVKSTTP